MVKNSWSLKKNAMTFWGSTTDAALRWLVPVQLSGELWVVYRVLFGYGMGSLYGLELLVIPLIQWQAADWRCFSKLTNGEAAVVALYQKTPRQSSMLTSPSTTPKSCWDGSNRRGQEISSCCKSKEDCSATRHICTNEGLNVKTERKAKLGEFQGECQRAEKFDKLA